MKSLYYQIALTLIPGVGSVIAKQLISYCGSLEAIFNTPKGKLEKIPGVGPKKAASIVNSKASMELIEKEIAFIQKENIKPVFFLDKEYPYRLKECDDGPVLLFQKGNFSLNTNKSIAIIGTRKSTERGKIWCEKFIEEISVYKPTIYSGLAYGIDACAHAAAVKNSVPTIGVLGHGLDRIYPYQNKGIAKSMITSNESGLLTEFLSGTNADRENFPKRNRIVAGLVDAVIVVESGEKGGALITADIASSYNREIFSVPGRVDDPYSKGCNFLIKSQKAQLIENAEEFAFFMGWEKLKKDSAQQQKLLLDLTVDEQLIIDFLRKQKQANIEEIRLETKISSGKVAATLLNLEFAGAVKSLPGNIFRII